MAISELPPVPSRNDPNGFAASANNFLGALPQFRLDLLEQAEIVEGFVDEAKASADVAILNAAQAVQSKSEAEFLAIVAQGAANYKGDYNPATPYSVGESITFGGDFYYSKVDENLGNTPVDGPFWAIRGDLSGGGSEAVITTPVSENANYALAFVVAPTFGAKGIKVATTGGLFNPATNTAGLNISGNAATATVAGSADVAGQVFQSSSPSDDTHRILLGNGTNSNAAVFNRTGLFFRQSTATIHGANITGNAGSVTNGVYNNGGTYAINISGNAATASSANFAANAGNASACSGNSASATVAGRWATPRNIALSGVVSGSVAIDGSGNVNLVAGFTQKPSPIPQVSLYAANGSFTVPAGVFTIRVTVVGGGGGGSQAATGTGGSGESTFTFDIPGGVGGAGGVAYGVYAVTPGQVIPVVVGAGGAGSNAGAGSAGGASSFGALASATGGAGAPGAGVNGAPGAGSGGNVRNLSGGFIDLFPYVYASSARVAGSTAAIGFDPGVGDIGAGMRGAGRPTVSTGTAVGGVGGAVIVEY